MMLIYGLMRGFVSMLRMLAERRHGRVKSVYEASEAEFGAIESDCKAEEVAIGRPLDYPGQLRLLKAYEQKEIARQKWVAATDTLAKRRSLEAKVRAFSGLKLPYSFGLVDMALLFRVAEEVTQFVRPEWTNWSSLFTSLLN